MTSEASEWNCLAVYLQNWSQLKTCQTHISDSTCTRNTNTFSTWRINEYIHHVRMGFGWVHPFTLVFHTELSSANGQSPMPDARSISQELNRPSESLMPRSWQKHAGKCKVVNSMLETCLLIWFKLTINVFGFAAWFACLSDKLEEHRPQE